jgi:hypothetical protein
VQEQLNQAGVDSAGFDGMLDRVEERAPIRFEDRCQRQLDACNQAQADAPATDFCEFLLTQAGKDACGLTPASR